jgi:hypothetical protein
LTDGYVALLDVLGFSALVGADPASERIHRYLECLQRATERSEVDYVVFSDSIVLTARGDGPDLLVVVAGACSRLMGELLNEGISVRGAIAFGSFFRSSIAQSVFVAGSAVIDAYRFEQLQDWVGVMVTPSALTQVPDLEGRCRLEGHTTVEAFSNVGSRLQWVAFIQRCYSIPFHSATPLESPSFDGFAVVPTSGVLEPVALRDSIKGSMDRLTWLRTIAPSPNSQRKYQQTLQWLGGIQRLWHDVAFRRD